MAKNENLGQTLWSIANELRGSMDADDFRDYMLVFLFLKYLSDDYEQTAAKELDIDVKSNDNALVSWYENNTSDVKLFEDEMRKKLHYIIKPEFLWTNIASLAKTQNNSLLSTLQSGFSYIENESFASSFQGLFSEINLDSEKLGKNYKARNDKLCRIIARVNEGLSHLDSDSDKLGDAYEYLIAQFAAGSGKKAGEFYTPQQISTILSEIVTLDSQDPRQGKKKSLENVLDFACGSGSLLLNIKKKMNDSAKLKIYGQESNITTYNLARMNMLLHGVKYSNFNIYHGCTLANEWGLLQNTNPNQKIRFDAVVANPPFSLSWRPSDAMSEDARFKNYGLAPKSTADFAFVLHGLHYLADEGTMAIVLPHGVLFRGGAEQRIRKKLLENDYIDTIIGLPANLFFSTGIPVCILVLKKCKKFDNILFINASEDYEKQKKQNVLNENHINKIIKVYKNRSEEQRFSKVITIQEIKDNDYNLNISRYVSTARPEELINLKEVNEQLNKLESTIKAKTKAHNEFLKELGLDTIDYVSNHIKK